MQIVVYRNKNMQKEVCYANLLEKLAGSHNPSFFLFPLLPPAPEVIRVFACDAQVRAYGWSAPWHAGGQVTLHGGGGTNLDPALQLIALLTKDGDLLPEQPLLIITDGLFAGEIRTEREHAYLLPKGAALGYRTSARVFHIQREE